MLVFYSRKKSAEKFSREIGYVLLQLEARYCFLEIQSPYKNPLPALPGYQIHDQLYGHRLPRKSDDFDLLKESRYTKAFRLISSLKEFWFFWGAVSGGFLGMLHRSITERLRRNLILAYNYWHN